MVDRLDHSELSRAADRAHEASILAHDIAFVVLLALSTDRGHLTIAAQEAVSTVADIAVEKAREARDAIDLLSGDIRTGGRRG